MSEPIKPYSTSGLSSKHQRDTIEIGGMQVPRYTGEFWTSKQRQACSIHEISYRACFKPQLPRLFIDLFTAEGDTVFDPFSGRGTTVIEAGLLGRKVIANDINPLSIVLCQPRFTIPTVNDIAKRLRMIRLHTIRKADLDLSMFYHPQTYREIVSLKKYLDRRNRTGTEDNLDRWIRMVATNRLTGHSKGFFSVYTLPPNQAVSQKSQLKINKKLGQKPEYRDTKKIILEKTVSLLRSVSDRQIANLRRAGRSARFYAYDCSNMPKIRTGSVQLTVTSPPFLNIVQYAGDNWLRCWFNGIDERSVNNKITATADLVDWSYVMEDVFAELFRVTKHGGWVAFEVGEIQKGSIKLDETIVPLATLAGFRCEGILINSQDFTKTSNIWGIKNNKRGTNSNRIALFYKG